jgi:hypothetical protein
MTSAGKRIIRALHQQIKHARSFVNMSLMALVVCPDGRLAEDWSQVRSPGRARRRRKQGHPQNIRLVYRRLEQLDENRDP